MNKILQGVLVVAGLLCTMGIASAQTVYNVFAPDQNDKTNPGGYNVTVVQTGNTFDITKIVGMGTNTDPNDATEITLTFYSTLGGNIPGQVKTTGTTLSGGAGAGVFTGAVETQPWSLNAAGAKVASDGDVVDDIGLSPIGADFFKMTPGSFFTVAGNARSFSINIQDGDQFTANVNLAPEASSVALLLAALLPIGLFALRRRHVASRMV